MIIDNNLLVSDAQALPNATTAFSTDVIDLRGLDFDGSTVLNASPNVGSGGRLHFAVGLSAVTAAGTLKIEVILGADASLTTPEVVGSTDALPAGVGDEPIIVSFDPYQDGAVAAMSYVGLRYTTSGNDSGIDATASLVLDAPSPKFYPADKRPGIV